MKEIKTYQELPNNYWNFIEKYLPNYTRRNDVLESDILTRYVENEEVDEDDLEWLPENKEEARKQLEELDVELYNESVEARNTFLKRMWKVRKACEKIRNCNVFKVCFRYPYSSEQKIDYRKFYSAIEKVVIMFGGKSPMLKIETEQGTVDIVDCLTIK